MKQIGHSILIFFASVLPLFLLAQKPSVTTSVNRNGILIGERIEYHVKTSMPDNIYRLSWFNLPDSFGNFVVVSRDKIDSSFANGNIVFAQTLVLTSFDSGRQVIPALSFGLERLNGDSAFKMLTDTIPIMVSYSPIDSIMPFHDIKPIMKVTMEKMWWKWLVAGLLLLIILFIIWRYRKKKKKADVVFDSKISDYDEAMQSLDQLETSKLIEKGEIKNYYSQLSDIFKKYLSRKTNRLQMHLTASEILPELMQYNVSRELLSDFANTLKTGEAVKFAKYLPPAEDSHKASEITRKIIVLIHSQQKEKPDDL